MIKATDRYRGNDIWMSLSAIYNPKFQDKAAINRIVVERAVPCLRKLLDLPKKLIVRIAPIKGRFNGRYLSTMGVIELDCRLDPMKALEVLCHECVHAEQYHTGRLSTHNYVHRWNGSINYNKGTTYKAYRNQPWEIEAWERQGELAKKVNEMLDSELDNTHP